jgi:hypothetical protein
MKLTGKLTAERLSSIFSEPAKQLPESNGE